MISSSLSHTQIVPFRQKKTFHNTITIQLAQ